MISLFYDIGIRLYAFGVRLAAIFNPKAADWVKGRRNFWHQLPSIADQDVIWFHCASLGEFDQGLPVMNALKKRQPEIFLLVTFFSPSGYAHYQKRQHLVDFACYLPIDTRINAKRFVKHFNPKMAVFVKYEFWSRYIFALKANGCKIYSVSTLLRPNHRFFKWYGTFFRDTLRQFDFFYVQNEQTAHLLSTIGIERVIVSGDTRFDRVIQNKETLQDNPLLSAFTCGHSRVLIAGSTWPEDENLLIPSIQSEQFEKVIIAPHAIDEKHIREITSALHLPHVRYSQVNHETDLAGTRVLVLDTIGHLASAYFYGTLAYVGGGFSGSLHNILEPAVFGLPVLFGPKHKRFPEAQAFIDFGIGFSVSTNAEFEQHVHVICSNLDNLADRCATFVTQNAGASEKIVAHLLSPVQNTQL